MAGAPVLRAFLRPASTRFGAVRRPCRVIYNARNSSTQTEKQSSSSNTPPPSTNSKPSKPEAPAFSMFTLDEPKKDPLEPANSKDAADHVLQPLARPIGLTIKPVPGQNSGVDTRDFQQRRDEFFNYDKHLERRKELTRKIAKPYFRNWSRMQFNAGKIFLAPTRLIRADKALYFPNLRGATLSEKDKDQDTTTVAKGCITLVRIFTGRWAEQQASTWIEDEKIKKLFEAGAGVLQRMDLNVEQNRMKSAIVRIMAPSIKKSLPEEMHARYFLIKKGFEEEYMHSLGMFNNQVGHVYLLDDQCRVRWGGSGDASQEERDSLVRGIVKLASELKDSEALKEPNTASSRERLDRSTVARFVARIPSILA